MFDKKQPTICYTAVKDENEENLIFKKIDFNEKIVPQILADLYNRKVQSIIIEGGNQLLAEFMQLGLWDEARIFQSGITFDKGISAPQINLDQGEKQKIDSDELITIFR